MKYFSPALILSGLLSACSNLPPPALSHFTWQTPRPFGYLIGDEIHHRISVQSRADLQLNPHSVPAEGAVNRWLQLNRVEIRGQPDTHTTVIDLSYQIFYAAPEVKTLTIPGFNLEFNQYGNAVTQVVPAWQFSVSPLQELAVRTDQQGNRYMRPDLAPEPLATASLALSLYLSLALGCAGYLAFQYGYFPAMGQRRIFKQAIRQLEQLPKTELGRGLAVMHHAFNSLYGQALFKHKLAEFYRVYPEYQSIAPQLDWFFNFSNQFLYSNNSSLEIETWGKLEDLSRLCREIERGSR
ncbi:nonribosomal peptide synthetase MxaA [Methylomonas paludis]|uniref:Nonribosomal peptide synthetase MxaA n=1 Tax=Methylomonas paludis TaxID=1173101 RepID=A0A975MLR7_9GAMM|nr:nonribosomal peptide synthetase MxaA [Methylomonas paludis]QWF70147.1 nonribosomal peptide synthetase MxaA [Methylomonas paludis]